MELGADGAIILRAPANAAVTVRRIPGARHDAKRQVWTLPLSWATCVTARGILGDSLEVGPRLAEWARNEQESRVRPALELRNATNWLTADVDPTLRQEVDRAARVG
jgi:hypothetical protein